MNHSSTVVVWWSSKVASSAYTRLTVKQLSGNRTWRLHHSRIATTGSVSTSNTEWTDGLWQTNSAKMTCFCWQNAFSSMCRMACGSVWSQLDVNWSAFHEDLCGNDLYIFMLIDVWPLFDVKFAPPVTHVYGHVSAQFEFLQVFDFWVNQLHGTDGWIEGLQYISLRWHSMESHMIIVWTVYVDLHCMSQVLFTADYHCIHTNVF